MKKLFETNTKLHSLQLYIKDKTANLGARLNAGKNLTKDTEYKIEDNSEKKIKAAKIIQRIWRGHKVKETIVKSPYFSYLSLIDPQDEQRVLSAIMFGRHEAELAKESQDRSENPFIYVNANYHRADFFHGCKGLIFDLLYNEFNLSVADKNKNIYIPVSNLKIAPVAEIIKSYKGIQLIEDKQHSIALVAIPQGHYSKLAIYSQLVSSGMIATPWEIAENIKNTNFDDEKSPQDFKRIALNANLPHSKEQLLESEIWSRLGVIASNKKYPAKKLAACLRRMLVDLPDLTPQAVQRIALMLDMANTFYSFNYPRYAFCVYTIIHEISLALLSNKDSNFLQYSFNGFLSESRITLAKILGLAETDLTKSTFIASPALSGTNALIIAREIAKTMQTQSGKTPQIQLIYPCHYFEFGTVLPHTTSSAKADIFVFSTGPIVNPEGVAPGVDINRFIKRNIIDKNRTKPTTLILDATTTLYKNMQLDAEAKALIAEGKLSILIIESHQKFGLLHTDQAQHGRMFALCSKESFTEEFIRKMQDKAHADFNEHTDMRIGGFISSHCGEILEDIKQQHFSNGALLRNILTQTSLASSAVISHQDMLTNLDELYFINSTNDLRKRGVVKGIIDDRSSFGHYATTLSDVVDQLRISPSATDDLDCLIQAAQIYLAEYYRPEQLLGMLLRNATQESLSPEEQIISLAMISNILLLQKNKPELLRKNPLELYCALDNILSQSTLLEGRVNFSEAYAYLLNLRKEIIDEEQPRFNRSYLAAINKLYRQGIPLDSYLLGHLKANADLTQAINLLGSITIDKKLITSLIDRPRKLALLLEQSKGLDVSLSLVNKLQAANIPIDLDNLLGLVTNSDSQVALHLVFSNGFSLTEREVSALIKPQFARFIIEQKNLLTKNNFSALIALSKVHESYEEFLPLLNNEDFCAALLFIDNAIEDILYNLKRAPEKYQLAREHSAIYLRNCFEALKTFYSKVDPQPDDQDALTKTLTQVKDDFCQNALGKDRSVFSKAARLALMGVVNFFAGLTLGVAHYLHYKLTNRTGFFTQTNSEKKIDEIHNTLDERIKKKQSPTLSPPSKN